MSKTASALRKRIKNASIFPSSLPEAKHDETKSYQPVKISHFLCVLGLIVVVFASVILVERRLPPALKIADEGKHPERFIAERAYNILKNLTSLGPRIAGSYTNDVLAVNLLKQEIDFIVQEAKDVHVIEVDVQKVNGSFNLGFLDGLTNVYRDLINVVVKIGSRINSPHSLLVNCHFDTVVESPGGSDDGAGCAVMLEMLRVISKSDRILKHNIIFLFNGGEENFMPASHGFITQHKWAKEIRAFINLEACGAGGREVLFQAGPNHPWILETYSEEVPYPYASSLAQEIFQSGVIPGDTDYRIFRDFGNVSGLDFAWSANGYVYHTKYDTTDQIPLGSLQRTGDNILALAKGMARGHQLANVESHRAGNLVFFDFLGAFVVRWPMYVGDIINIATVIVSFYTVYVNLRENEESEVLSPRKHLKKLVQNMVAGLIALIAPVIACIAIAIALNALDRTMSWFARPIWIFFLYIIPTFLVSMGVIYFHAKSRHKDLELSPWVTFQLYYDAYQILWTLLLVFGIAARFRSSFVALLWTAFPALGNVLKTKLFGKWRDAKWLLLHIAVVGLPFVQCFYLIMSALYLFVPIMGRSGAGNNAEILIAVIVSAMHALLFTSATPLVVLVRGVGRVFSILWGLFLISIAVLLLTPMGFPYSGKPGSLAPERFMIAHAQRTFHDVNGAITEENSGFWIVDMDINSPHIVARSVPQLKNALPVEKDCENYLYCGMPYLVPVLTMIWKTHWLPAPPPKIVTPISMAVTSRENIPGGERISLKVEGPNHVGVMVAPVKGVELAGWSFEGTEPLAGPRWNGRDTYFIYYAYGRTPVALEFSMDFKLPKSHSGPVMDIAVTSHYLFGPGRMTPDLDRLISKFPNWTTVSAWTATYESWIL